MVGSGGDGGKFNAKEVVCSFHRGRLLAFLNVATKNKVLNVISSNDARNAYWYLLVTWKNV